MSTNTISMRRKMNLAKGVLKMRLLVWLETSCPIMCLLLCSILLTLGQGVGKHWKFHLVHSTKSLSFSVLEADGFLLFFHQDLSLIQLVLYNSCNVCYYSFNLFNKYSLNPYSTPASVLCSGDTEGSLLFLTSRNHEDPVLQDQ